MNHELEGAVDAASMIALAAAGDLTTASDSAPLREAIDSAIAGDSARETMYALAAFAGGYVAALAHFQGQPVANVLDRLAGVVTEEG